MLLLPIFKKKNPSEIHCSCIFNAFYLHLASKGAENAGLMILQFLYFHFDAQFKKYL